MARRADSADISVIIRALDEAKSLGRCLELIASQQTGGLNVETVVVDSGSHDNTVAIARVCWARVLTMPQAAFSFGGALNLGAANARGEVLVALSAHAFATDQGWLGRLVGALSDPSVACASGERYTPEGEVLRGPVRQDQALARRQPGWGYSNAAGAFRASLWRERPFRADLPACEDKEWAWYWLQRGYVSVVDPGLLVDHDHTHDPIASIYRRARREAEGLATVFDLPAYGPRVLAREWWSDRRYYGSALKARLSHRRAARLLGTYAGKRRVARR
jgi:glycosyltransferase involved in cell wall biosynthesis